MDTFEDLAESGKELLAPYEKLELNIDDDHVAAHIRGTNRAPRGMQFLGRLEDYEKGTAYFVIRTFNWETGERHSFFERHRASELAARAIRHFELTYPVNGIEFDWKRKPGFGREPSTNYTDYLNERNRLKNEMPIEEAQSNAVFATWTGRRIALPNGFTKLGAFEDTPESPRSINGTIWRDEVKLDS
jgi:hypothetical protein